MKNTSFKIFIYAVYLILLITGLSHHEMWRDEYEEFLQARDAEGLFGLSNTMSQGHAMLWQGCLWIITRFSHDPLLMKVFHGLIAAGFAFVLLFKSPFKTWQSGLLLLSYFLLFEYSVISRCYAFGVLFIFLFAHNYTQNLKLTIQGAIFLFLLANTSVYGVLLTAVITAWIFTKDMLFTKPTSKAQLFKSLPLFLFVGLGIIIAYLQIHPRADNKYPIHLVIWPFDQYRFDIAITQFFAAFAPVYKAGNQHFWNSNFMMNSENLIFWVYPALVFVIVSIPFVRNARILLLWTSGVVLLLFFQYYTGLRFARYYGHFFLLWVLCMWLMTLYTEHNSLYKKLNTAIFILVLIPQVAGGIMIYNADRTMRFSRGAEAAEYLKSKGFAKNYMIGTVDFALSPIAAELDRKIYYMQHKKLCSFTRWDTARLNSMDSLDLAEALQSGPQNETLIFIATHPIPQFSYFREAEKKKPLKTKFVFSNFTFKCLAYFKPGIEGLEGYWIFTADRNKI